MTRNEVHLPLLRRRLRRHHRDATATQITGVRGDPDHPANFGRLCTKGSTLHLTATGAVTQQARLLHPMLRDAARRGAPSASLGRRARLRGATASPTSSREHGPDAVGFYISGQLLTEDYYVFNKLAKGLIGTNNVDTNSRLCMSSAVAGYKLTLGADAPPACYDDMDHADCIFIAGTQHGVCAPDPVPPHRGRARRRNPAMKIIVADPRRTDTAERRRPAPADPARHRRRAVQRHAAHHAVGRLDRPDYIAAHTERLRRAEGARCATTRRSAWRRPAASREDDLVTAARWFGDARRRRCRCTARA